MSFATISRGACLNGTRARDRVHAGPAFEWAGNMIEHAARVLADTDDLRTAFRLRRRLRVWHATRSRSSGWNGTAADQRTPVARMRASRGPRAQSLTRADRQLAGRAAAVEELSRATDSAPRRRRDGRRVKCAHTAACAANCGVSALSFSCARAGRTRPVAAPAKPACRVSGDAYP